MEIPVLRRIGPLREGDHTTPRLSAALATRAGGEAVGGRPVLTRRDPNLARSRPRSTSLALAAVVLAG